MNGKENIINKILSDADDKCAQIAAAAAETARNIAAEADKQIALEEDKLQQKLAAFADERKRNAVAVAQLDARKYRLNARRQLVSRCYDIARQRLAAMSPTERLQFVGTLLEQYAEQGETVYVTQADSASVTQKYLDGFDKGLVLGKRLIVADGGVVLEGVGYDKNLTLDNVVRYSRDKSEARVAAYLLGDGDEQ